ncbi:MAG: gliding motility-associated C-terminal domain-containing protein [Bacteroidetes bacterium]|nr:gliding motility-associated C-terminal domain-containing protein [Bacteroidota bacterium]
MKFKAQSVADCNNAQNVCSNPNFTFNATSVGATGLNSGLNISNPSANPQIGNGSNYTTTPNAGCLLTNGPGPQWLLMNIATTGTLGFCFGAAGSANPQVGFYDWAMWPYNSSTCNQIFSNTLPPAACNWNAASSGGTGMGPVPTGGNSGNFQPPINVTAGQQYLVLISNYSYVNTLVSFTSTGSAQISCGFNFSICAGQTATVSPIGFSPMTAASYTIMPGGNINTTGVYTVNPSTSIIYTITGSGISLSGSAIVQTSTTSITVYPQPSISPSFTQATCSNSNNAVNLNYSSIPATSSYTVNWSPLPASVTSYSQTYASNLYPGITSVTVTANGGCSVQSNFTMSAAISPTFSLFALNGYSLTCNNNLLTFSVSASYTPSSTFYWINSSSTFTSSLTQISVGSSTAVGTYSVSITDPVSMCSNTQTFNIGQNILVPTSSLSGTSFTLNCVSAAPTITNIITSPTVNVSTTWSLATVTGTPPSIVSGPFNGTSSIYNPSPGTITVLSCNTVNGCCNSKTITINSTSVYPTFQPTSTTNFTLGCGASASTTLMAYNAQGGVPLTYTFIPPGVPVSIPIPTAMVTSTSPAVSTNSPGIWTMIVQDGVSKCQTAIPVSVIQNTFGPPVSCASSISGYTLTCFNPTFNVTANSTNTNATIQWLVPSSSPVVPSATVTAGVITTGPSTSTALGPIPYAVYTVQATDNNNKCMTTQTLQLFQSLRPPTNMTISGAPFAITCRQPSVNLTIVPINTASNAPGQYSGVLGGSSTWFLPQPSGATLTGASIYAYVGNQTYSVLVTDLNNGCVKTLTYHVTEDVALPIITKTVFTVPIDCATNNATVQTVLSNSIISWNLLIQNFPLNTQFSNPNLTTIGALNTGYTNVPFTVNSPGLYNYLITNNINGCRTQGNFIVVQGTLQASFIPSALQGFAPLTVYFNNNSTTSTGSSGISSLWAFGNGTTYSTSTISSMAGTAYQTPGTYTVVLTAFKGQCVGSTSAVIYVDIPSKLDVPNVFTPNNDGVNDVFFVKAINLTEINAIIFDRWGNVVYKVDSDTGNITWDGKNQYGAECAAGVYFYTILATGKDKLKYEKQGTLSLFR